MKLQKQIRGYEGLYEIRSDGAIISMPREKRLPNGKLCQSKERVMSPARIGEDVPEEPEEYWFIDYDGGIIPFSRMKETATDRMMKQIGNYFDSREEAEKAVEKLKAWKRLKDKGFRFTGLSNESIGYEIKELSGDFALDLDLLFNGGENG